ncbi:MAG: sensor histidine kinase [Lachnospiraceae bacterium]|nr:sensor histidine kinase [Lachnospiraceae bacterium]
MEKLKWYQLVLKYLHEHVKMALTFALFTAIYAVVFFLYDLEAEAIFYAVVLCVLVSIVILGAGFIGFYGEYRRRLLILNDIQLEFENLPEADTLLEEDYQQMVRALGRINIEHLTDWQKERQESLDYYTTWAHQIKTPIAVMRMTLQGEDTEEHRELLAELFRIEQYVEMVLSYIRLGSHQSDFVFQECDLDAIIKQAVHKYAAMFVRCRVSLVYEPVEMTVLTDEKWLLFIIEQLLSNAVKYTREGTVTISVSPEQVLSVADTGMGIAPEDLPRIFEKGFTGYHGRADKKATGLGLYLCRQTADKLGIRISVRSEVGKGSTFFLDLHKERPMPE